MNWILTSRKVIETQEPAEYRGTVIDVETAEELVSFRESIPDEEIVQVVMFEGSSLEVAIKICEDYKRVMAQLTSA